MHIGALQVELFIADSNCLKSKRSVVKGLKERIRNKFNVSVSEIDDHDKWQKACLGIACASPDKAHANSVLDHVMDLIRSNGAVQVVDFEMEIL